MNNSPKAMNNKTAIITGISGDIGKAIAYMLDKEGYEIIGFYNTDKESTKELSATLSNPCHFYQADMADMEALIKRLNNIKDNFGNTTLLINNAGLSIVGELRDLTIDNWQKIWNVNVSSTIFMSQFVTPIMLQNGGGHIINISSVWGNRGASCESAYSATKGAIDSFTKAYAKELAPSHIQVNAIAPGYIDTKMNSHLDQEDVNSIIEEIPANRLGQPEDVADAISGLLKAGNYITGQIISVDGAWQV